MPRARKIPKCELRPAWTQRRVADVVVLDLPLCPPVNNLFYNRPASRGGGRGKTRTYRSWMAAAVAFGSIQRPARIVGLADVTIDQPAHRADTDAICKALIDAAVVIGVIANDAPRYVRNVHLLRDASPTYARLTFTTVTAAAEPERTAA